MKQKWFIGNEIQPILGNIDYGEFKCRLIKTDELFDGLKSNDDTDV